MMLELLEQTLRSVRIQLIQNDITRQHTVYRHIFSTVLWPNYTVTVDMLFMYMAYMHKESFVYMHRGKPYL